MGANKLVTKHKRQTAVFLDHENYEWLVSESKRTGKSQGAIIRAALDTIRKVNQLLSEKVAA